MSAIVDRSVSARVAGQRSAEVRGERSRLRAEAKAGRLSVAAPLSDPPSCLGTLRVSRLLGWQRFWGLGIPGGADALSRLMLAVVDASETLLVRDLTDRQRGRLVEQLSAFGVGG